MLDSTVQLLCIAFTTTLTMSMNASTGIAVLDLPT